MQRQSLVFETDVQQTFVSELIRAREPPKTETVIDRDANDWLTNLDRLFDNERKVVTLIGASTCTERSVCVLCGECSMPYHW